MYMGECQKDVHKEPGEVRAFISYFPYGVLNRNDDLFTEESVKNAINEWVKKNGEDCFCDHSMFMTAPYSPTKQS